MSFCIGKRQTPWKIFLRAPSMVVCWFWTKENGQQLVYSIYWNPSLTLGPLLILCVQSISNTPGGRSILLTLSTAFVTRENSEDNFWSTAHVINRISLRSAISSIISFRMSYFCRNSNFFCFLRGEAWLAFKLSFLLSWVLKAFLLFSDILTTSLSNTVRYKIYKCCQICSFSIEKLFLKFYDEKPVKWFSCNTPFTVHHIRYIRKLASFNTSYLKLHSHDRNNSVSDNCSLRCDVNQIKKWNLSTLSSLIWKFEMCYIFIHFLKKNFWGCPAFFKHNGLHLNHRGSQVLAHNIVQCISLWLPTPPTPVYFIKPIILSWHNTANRAIKAANIKFERRIWFNVYV